jgi:tetratricopeptide (TPR) repeat protein
MRPTGFHIFALILLAWPAVVRPQTNDPRALSDRGLGHYRRGEYDLAIRDFQASFLLRPLPELLFNIAQAYRLQGNCNKALQSYSEYLRVAPNGRLRERVIARMAAMQECRDVVAPSLCSTCEVAIREANTTPQPPPIATDASPFPDEEPSPALIAPLARPRATTPAPPPIAIEASQSPQRQPLPALLAPLARPRASAQLAPVVKKRWFWGVVAAGAIVVAGSVSLAVVFSTRDRYPAQPSLGSFPGN